MMVFVLRVHFSSLAVFVCVRKDIHLKENCFYHFQSSLFGDMTQYELTLEEKAK